MRRLTPDRLESDSRPLRIGVPAGKGADTSGPGTASAPSGPTMQEQLEASFAKAKEQGLAEGRLAAEAELAKRIQAAEARLRESTEAALKKLEEERARLLSLAASIEAAVSRHALDSEELAVEVAYAALVRVLGDAAREHSLIPDVCRAIVREYGHPTATLRVSDLDLPLLADVDLGVPVEADRRLSAGEAVIDTARGQFECGLDVRLAAIASTLAATLAAHRSNA
jgi:flagellar biosynthesis/type III secretory pathway protein FliH